MDEVDWEEAEEEAEEEEGNEEEDDAVSDEKREANFAETTTHLSEYRKLKESAYCWQSH